LNRIHALAASTIVALSAIFGVAAMATTHGIGEPKAAESQVSDQAFAARQRKLNRAEAALRKARARKPPPLPPAPAAAAQAPRVVAQSAPAPVVNSASDDDDSDFDDSDFDDDDFEDDDEDEFEDDDD
jgi:hypothetical protein